MRVLHVIPSLSPSQGGPSFALPMMAKALAAKGVQVHVAATDDDGPGKHISRTLAPHQERDGFRVFYFPKQTEFYKFSRPLGSWLGNHAGDYDVMHIHGVFSHACFAAAKAARKNKMPHIIRPLGILNRWGMENRRRWLKDASFRFLDRPMLDQATAIHYTSGEEQQEAARLNLRARPVVIPLGIEVAPFLSLPAAELFHQRHPGARSTRNILFMSRINLKKGIEPLLEAFAAIRAQFDGLHLVIAGEGGIDYAASLKEKARMLGIEHHVTWPGFLDGGIKLAALAAAELFVLPSHSENFGIALLEAMAAGLPCITTPNVALAKDMLRLDEQSLLMTPNTPDKLADALSQMLRDPARAKQMGATGQSMARQHFSTESMADALIKLYTECIAR